VLSVEKQDIDAEAHPERVNAVGWADQQAVAGGKRAAAHEAHKASECVIRNSYPVSQN
jgi:hypothetical protein